MDAHQGRRPQSSIRGRSQDRHACVRQIPAFMHHGGSMRALVRLPGGWSASHTSTLWPAASALKIGWSASSPWKPLVAVGSDLHTAYRTARHRSMPQHGAKREEGGATCRCPPVVQCARMSCSALRLRRCAHVRPVTGMCCCWSQPPAASATLPPALTGACPAQAGRGPPLSHTVRVRWQSRPCLHALCHVVPALRARRRRHASLHARSRARPRRALPLRDADGTLQRAQRAPEAVVDAHLQRGAAQRSTMQRSAVQRNAARQLSPLCMPAAQAPCRHVDRAACLNL